MREPSMDDWIHKMISTRTPVSSEACTDENVMAAYLEGTLSPQEKLLFETHVSECADCREVLALVMKMQDGEQKTFAPESDESKLTRKTWFHFSIPVPVLGGVFVALIFMAGIFLLMRDSGENLHPTQSAQLRIPAPENEMLKQNIPEASLARNAARSELDKPRMAVPAESPEPGIEAPVAPAREMKAEAVPSAAPSNQVTNSKAEAPALSGEETTIFSQGKRSVAAPALGMKSQQADERQLSIQADKAEDAKTKDMAKSEEGVFQKIGDKEFYLDSGYWTDRQCLEHPGVPVVEISPADPEYKSILSQYPDLLKLTPARIFSSGRIYVIR